MTIPFVKWAGGKRTLAEAISKKLPQQIHTYFEPMVGGGAVFFYLSDQKQFERAWLNDMNEELITTYNVIKHDLSALILRLRELEHKHAKAKNKSYYYYKVRELNPARMPVIDVAARMIYLNHTCFNGLYRVNKKGGFNVPFGNMSGKIFDEQVLKNTNLALQRAKLTSDDYTNALAGMTKKDAAYFDPPYWPIKKGGFISYTDTGFDSNQQIRLASLAKKLNKLGLNAIFSNNDLPAIRNLYKGLHFSTVECARNISCSGVTRKKVKELLICTNKL